MSEQTSVKGKILVIDDSELVLEITRDALQEVGYQVLTNSSWVEVNATIREHRPNLILLDLMMPSIKGESLCEILKKSSFGRDIPIIIFSTKEESEIKRLAEDVRRRGLHRQAHEQEGHRRQRGLLLREVLRFLRPRTARPRPRAGEHAMKKARVEKVVKALGPAISRLQKELAGKQGTAEERGLRRKLKRAQRKSRRLATSLAPRPAKKGESSSS